MIINFPTGLYKDVLPTTDTSGNVTFTISNNQPPRTDLLFQKISRGVVDRKRTNINRTPNKYELIYSINYSSKAIEGNSARIFHVGQILEFSDITQNEVEPMYVGNKSEIQHNINKFDYLDLGLSNEEEAIINDSSSVVYDMLLRELNDVIRLRADSEVKIANYQKKFNDIVRNIEALQVILSNNHDPAVVDIYIKFTASKDEIESEIKKLIIDANAYAAKAFDLKDKINKLAMVVK